MWKKRPFDVNKEAKIRALGQPNLLARLLSQREIEFSKLDSFLSNAYKNLSKPHDLHGIKEASELFCSVARNKGKVAVIGDYDCDGVLSAVMIKELCNVFGLKCTVFLPSRIEHGYGLNEQTIKAFEQKIKATPDLLIITDCGSNNEKEIQSLKSLGIKKVIIIDHHIIDSDKISKSADVLINWHQTNDPETCACGEVFHFIRGIRWLTKKVNPIEFLSYAAMGILADVSPIIGDNRIIVKHGLGEYALNHIVASGCNALLRKSGVYGKEVTQSDVLFKIAPRINAVGRLFRPDVAFNLMIEHDPSTAELMAVNLSEYNDDRKKIQKTIEKEAIRHVQSNPDKYKHGIVLYHPEWPVGIIGIVASRVSDTFCKPTIIIGKSGNVLKGSGRSIEHINLKDILDSCKEMFNGHGGHAMAAGVTLKPDYLDKANDLFNEACNQYYEVHGRPSEVQYYDVEIRPKFVTTKLAEILLEKLYPYCQQFNPEPIFLLRNVRIVDVQVYEKDESKTILFNATSGDDKTQLKFRMFGDDVGGEIEGMTADIYFTMPQSIQPNRFNSLPQINVIEFVPKK